MTPRPFDFFFSSPIFRDSVLIVLIAAILALAVLSLLFAAAILLLRMRNVAHANERGQLEALWEPLLLDYFIGAVSREAVCRRVGRGEEIFFLVILHRLALRVAGDEIDRITELAASFLPVLIEQARSSDSMERARAIDLIGKLGADAAKEPLIGALDDSSALVVMTAARHLFLRFDPITFTRGIYRLSMLPGIDARMVGTLAAGAGQEAVMTLQSILSGSRHAVRMRTIAAWALAEIRDLQSADTAAIALESGDRELAAACLRMLENSGLPEHREAVRKAFASTDPVLRSRAALVLGRIADASDRESLAHGIEDPSPWVALNAAWGLRHAGGLDELQRIALLSTPASVFARQVLEESSE